MEQFIENFAKKTNIRAYALIRPVVSYDRETIAVTTQAVGTMDYFERKSRKEDSRANK